MTDLFKAEFGSRVLVVMAKAPILGIVKTRLCPPHDLEYASSLYHCFLQDIFEKVSFIDDISVTAAYTPSDSLDFFTELAPYADYFIAQSGDDLGERMMRYFESLCNGKRAVVMIGSDSPTLLINQIVEAFDFLTAHQADLVIGPSTDGGYYLIGMIQPYPMLFKDIAWSTSNVLAQTIKCASDMGLHISLLKEWYDVDSPEDLVRLINEIQDWRSEYGCLPVHTARYLRSTR